MRSTARRSTTSSGSRRPRSWPPPTGTLRPRVRSASPTSTSRPAWPTRSRSCTMPRARSPVLLTAGQQDTRLLVHEPILAGDLVKMAEPFTKWAYEIRSADEAVSVLGRAVTIALTPPTGPVFLSLPMDLMTDETDAPAPRTQGPSAQRPGIPGMADVTRACGLLAGARAPLIIAGDGVGRAPDGVAALTRLAEALGARVYGEPIYRRTNFPGDHSLWRGGLYPSVPAVRTTLDDADVILI